MGDGCAWPCQCMCVRFHPSIRSSVRPSVRPSIHPSIHLSSRSPLHFSVHTSIHPMFIHLFVPDVPRPPEAHKQPASPPTSALPFPPCFSPLLHTSPLPQQLVRGGRRVCAYRDRGGAAQRIGAALRAGAFVVCVGLGHETASEAAGAGWAREGGGGGAGAVEAAAAGAARRAGAADCGAAALARRRGASAKKVRTGVEMGGGEGGRGGWGGVRYVHVGGSVEV
eukprot:311829-Chlamydomonas_euryale.AAC.5